MRLLRSSSRTTAFLGGLAAGVVGVGLLAGGVWYAVSHSQAPSLLDSLTRRASAQEVATTSPAAPPQATPPAAGNIRRPTGQVTQIATDPAAFTIQGPDGALTTYRVLDTTVFMAGRDRPYHFDLLKVGDTVTVLGGGRGQGQAPAAVASPQPAGAGGGNRAAKPNAGGQAAARGARAGTATAADEPIARQVIVRPAADANKRAAGAAGAGQAGRLPNGQNPGAQNGGSDAAGQ